MSHTTSSHHCCAVDTATQYIPHNTSSSYANDISSPTINITFTRSQLLHDATDQTVAIKFLGCLAVWAIYIASLANSYSIYQEHNKKLLQLIQV